MDSPTRERAAQWRMASIRSASSRRASVVGVGVGPDAQLGAGRDRGAMAGGEVVEDDHLVAGGQECLGRYRADIAGAACDQDPRHAPRVREAGSPVGAGPETYLGHGQAPGFAAPDEIREDQPPGLTAPLPMRDGPVTDR